MKIDKATHYELGIDIKDRMWMYLIEGDNITKMIFKNREEVKKLIEDLENLMDSQELLEKEHEG